MAVSNSSAFCNLYPEHQDYIAAVGEKIREFMTAKDEAGTITFLCSISHDLHFPAVLDRFPDFQSMLVEKKITVLPPKPSAVGAGCVDCTAIFFSKLNLTQAAVHAIPDFVASCSDEKQYVEAVVSYVDSLNLVSDQQQLRALVNQIHQDVYFPDAVVAYPLLLQFMETVPEPSLIISALSHFVPFMQCRLESDAGSQVQRLNASAACANSEDVAYDSDSDSGPDSFSDEGPSISETIQLELAAFYKRVVGMQAANPEVIAAFIRAYITCEESLSPVMRIDGYFMLYTLAVQADPNGYENRDMAVELVSFLPLHFFILPDSVKEDSDFIYAVLSRFPLLFFFINEKFACDEEVIRIVKLAGDSMFFKNDHPPSLETLKKIREHLDIFLHHFHLWPIRKFCKTHFPPQGFQQAIEIFSQVLEVSEKFWANIKGVFNLVSVGMDGQDDIKREIEQICGQVFWNTKSHIETTRGYLSKQ